MLGGAVLHQEKGIIPGEERGYFSSETDGNQEKVKSEAKEGGMCASTCLYVVFESGCQGA